VDVLALGHFHSHAAAHARGRVGFRIDCRLRGSFSRESNRGQPFRAPIPATIWRGLRFGLESSVCLP
jgi:hypothetical protein